jgi:hypothetical protein
MTPYNEGLFLAFPGDDAFTFIIKKGVSGFVAGANVQVTMQGVTSSVQLAVEGGDGCDDPTVHLPPGYCTYAFCPMGGTAPDSCNPYPSPIEVGDTIRIKLL